MNADALQRRAQLGLLPFCVALLSGRAPRPGTGRLPLRTPEALTAEVVEAIQDMASKAVYRWLFAELGWESRELVHPDDPEATVQGRLWDPAIWGERRLSFTEETVDALLLAWNLVAPVDDDEVHRQVQRPTGRTWTRMTAEARRQWVDRSRKAAAEQLQAADSAQLAALSGAALGDLLLGHVLARPIVAQRILLTEGRRWTHNPLTQLMAYDVAQTDDLLGLQRLLAPDILPLMPWISAEWPRLWRARRGLGPTTHERLRHTWLARAHIWGAWITLAAQASHLELLAPLIEGYRDLVACYPEDQDALARLSAGWRIQDRQALCEVWAESWTPLQQLQQHALAARRLHPVDREAHHRLFLAAAAALDLTQIAAQGAAIAHDLRATIG